MKDNISSTSTTRKQLMFTEVKMKKEERSSSGENTMVTTRDGESSTPIQRVPRKLPQDSTKNGVSISTEHSISDQDSQ
jgi:hypothetical protein